MELTPEIKKYIDKSVLCWLASVSNKNIPNVSPKEIFTYYGNKEIIIANIASPQTIQNIIENRNVCISFIDIFVQKGYQLKGQAEILEKNNSEFDERNKILQKLTDGKFPFNSITKIFINSTKKIVAPKYLLYPDTTEKEQIENAKKTYGL